MLKWAGLGEKMCVEEARGCGDFCIFATLQICVLKRWTAV